MNLSELFIRRPVMTVLLNAAIIGADLMPSIGLLSTYTTFSAEHLLLGDIDAVASVMARAHFHRHIRAIVVFAVAGEAQQACDHQLRPAAVARALDGLADHRCARQ